jgi:Protein phosphatase 2C
MQSEASDDSHFCVETRPLENLSIGITMNNLFHLQLLSFRCREAEMQALVNQDYARVMVQRDTSFLCFCVCDGVGSSYRGDFAAHYLGERLVRWLQQWAEGDWSLPAMKEQLGAQLVLWAEEAQQELLQQELPSELPKLVREVLEELRASYGSETVFLGGCLRIAPLSSQPADMVRSIEAFFCWMGNVSARLFLSPDHVITLGAEDDRAARWSTVHGSRGPLTVLHIGPTQVERLLVYTDGLHKLDNVLTGLDQETLQDSIQQLLQAPENDDMTYFDIQWLPQEVRNPDA